ncbi:hypothetical protein CI109_100515 [Kwoniella shandongensis]|uniref:Uncharacterized protein n=1 Tax=Kwoniella shandongensis TaxID=1734106 RepID=A0A5M6BN86_9TREE|nr:uncharacterized protein CI109_007355 [Kwoniella shandongensis]KAA5524308.1 hypothetical protein CI109_007355 [Kwoniella shandongensis]
MFGNKHHTHQHHDTYRENRIRGLRSAINNPRTTHAGRTRAQHELHAMGARSTHPSLGTRLRHIFHLPAKSRGHRTTHHGGSHTRSHHHGHTTTGHKTLRVTESHVY